jgi:hypothetical protein
MHCIKIRAREYPLSFSPSPTSGGSDMRRKGGLSPAAIERRWPHQVVCGLILVNATATK